MSWLDAVSGVGGAVVDFLRPKPDLFRQTFQPGLSDIGRGDPSNNATSWSSYGLRNVEAGSDPIDPNAGPFLSGDQTAAWQQALGPTSEYAIATREQQKLDDAARWYGTAAKNQLAYEQAGAAARAAAALAARRAAISKMYDQMLGTLTTNRTNAQGQINASNVALQQALGTIDRRGARQSAALNSALQALFANAINQSRGDYATAMADMGQYGAGPGRMSMTQAEQLGLLRGQAARTRAFGAELGNIRSQAMDTARSQGNLLTSGTRQQLWAEDAAMRAQIERERLAAMARAAGG